MKLLLADDDSDQLELRGLTLAQAGYEVCSGANVSSALWVAQQQKPDVAVVDLRLPTQEDGLKLIRELKKLDAGLRVIVLTGADTAQFEKLPERAMVEAVFSKGGASKLLMAHLRDGVLAILRRRLAEEGQLMLEVKVIPRSSKSEIGAVMADGSMKVKLAAVPEKGKANEELVALLAGAFNVSKAGVEVVTGETSQRKRVRIRAT